MHRRSLTRFFLVLALVLLIQPCFAQPKGDLLQRILRIADADQIEIFNKLNLSDDQLYKIRLIGESYLPKIRKLGGEPAKVLPLVPQAMGEVDAILTPRQRPLARKLFPRPHQWEPLRRLYLDR